MILCGFEKFQNLLVNGSQLLFGRHAIGAALNYAAFHLPLKPGYSNHKKLVQVGAQDGEKLYPLKQRVLVVLSLLQHSFLEGKKAEFPVNVESRIAHRTGVGRRPIWFDSCCWRLPACRLTRLLVLVAEVRAVDIAVQHILRDYRRPWLLTLSRGGVGGAGLDPRMVKAFENAVALCKRKATEKTEPL